MPSLTLKDVLDAIMCDHKVLGERELSVDSARPIDMADDRSITFCSKQGEQGKRSLIASKAGLVIVGMEHEKTCSELQGSTYIIVNDPRLAFARVLRRYFDRKREVGVHDTVVVGDDVDIAPDAYIGPFCSLGDHVKIGAGSRLLGSNTVYSGVQIGQNVTVHAGAVIGTDGFGYNRDPAGDVEKFPHIGGVVVGDDVEIGSNTCIARGTLLDTIIGKGTKIDNQVHIAHNVRIGEGCLIIAHVQIAGSVTVGNRCWLAPSCTITTGVTIGDDAMVAMGAVVVRDVDPGSFVAGSPARPTIRKR